MMTGCLLHFLVTNTLLVAGNVNGGGYNAYQTRGGYPSPPRSDMIRPGTETAGYATVPTPPAGGDPTQNYAGPTSWNGTYSTDAA